jgi:hypothetical protein
MPSVASVWTIDSETTPPHMLQPAGARAGEVAGLEDVDGKSEPCSLGGLQEEVREEGSCRSTHR